MAVLCLEIVVMQRNPDHQAMWYMIWFITRPIPFLSKGSSIRRPTKHFLFQKQRRKKYPTSCEPKKTPNIRKAGLSCMLSSVCWSKT